MSDTSETGDIGQQIEQIGEAIDRQRIDTAGAQILTRSQTRYQEAETAVGKLTIERNAIRERLIKGRENMERLQNLLSILENSERDCQASIDAELQAIHSLRQAGVTL